MGEDGGEWRFRASQSSLAALHFDYGGRIERPLPGISVDASREELVHMTAAATAQGLLLHGQSVNISAVTLVDAVAAAPTGAALRWMFRNSLGWPTDGATVFRRTAPNYDPIAINFATPVSVDGWLDVSFVRVRALGKRTVIDANGLVMDGVVEIASRDP